MYLAYRDGLLTASGWGKIERTVSDLVAYPGVQQWWETRRHWHTEEFGRVIDEMIARETSRPLTEATSERNHEAE